MRVQPVQLGQLLAGHCARVRPRRWLSDLRRFKRQRRPVELASVFSGLRSASSARSFGPWMAARTVLRRLARAGGAPPSQQHHQVAVSTRRRWPVPSDARGFAFARFPDARTLSGVRGGTAPRTEPSRFDPLTSGRGRGSGRSDQPSARCGERCRSGVCGCSTATPQRIQATGKGRVRSTGRAFRLRLVTVSLPATSWA